MNDSGQWADASGNTYNVEHPLDEVTVKYDPKTGGQINKADRLLETIWSTQNAIDCWKC